MNATKELNSPSTPSARKTSNGIISSEPTFANPDSIRMERWFVLRSQHYSEGKKADSVVVELKEALLAPQTKCRVDWSKTVQLGGKHGFWSTFCTSFLSAIIMRVEQDTCAAVVTMGGSWTMWKWGPNPWLQPNRAQGLSPRWVPQALLWAAEQRPAQN